MPEYKPKTTNIAAIFGFLAFLFIVRWLESNVPVGSFREIPVLGDADQMLVKPLCIWALFWLAVVLSIKVVIRQDEDEE